MEEDGVLIRQLGNLSHEKKEKILIGIYIIFFMYLCLMFWEVFMGSYRSHSQVRQYNLYPFATIREFIVHSSKYSFNVIFINLAANIITFMPLGFFITLILRKKIKLMNTASICVFIIICIEIVQFILNVGVLDIDDVILNTMGCVLGFGIYKAVYIFSYNRLNN